MKKQTASLKSRQLSEIMQKAISEEIERKRKLGEPIAIWKDGKVVVGKVEDLLPSTQP
jgi:hypothetical protein